MSASSEARRDGAKPAGMAYVLMALCTYGLCRRDGAKPAGMASVAMACVVMACVVMVHVVVPHVAMANVVMAYVVMVGRCKACLTPRSGPRTVTTPVYSYGLDIITLIRQYYNEHRNAFMAVFQYPG